jgi:hypothetical protein
MTLPIPREFPGNATPETLTGAVLTSSATSCTMSGNAGWTTGANGPFAVVINRGGANEEKCLVSAQAASTLTFSARGYDGTAAQTHQVGESIQPCLTALDMAEANAHTSSIAGVHGLTTAVAGIADVQTISNKAMDASNTYDGLKMFFGQVTYSGGSTTGPTAFTHGAPFTPLLGFVNMSGGSPSNSPASIAQLTSTQMFVDFVLPATSCVLSFVLYG